MIRASLAIPIVAIVLSGCVRVTIPGDRALLGAVSGSGVEAQQERDVPGFDGIEITSAMVATVVVGEDQRVVVRADDNVVDLVVTEVRGDRLVVGLESGTRILPRSPIVIEIGAPDLEYAEASGASTIDVDGIAGTSAKLVASGASRVVARGTTGDLSVEASGASTVDARQVAVQDATVHASGASRVTVDAAGRLDGDASGASTVCYASEPEEVRVDASGASTVGRCP